MEEVSVNLTPLIDVVFLLLIFFMVSTTFTRETQLSIDLPEATGQARETVDTEIEILIDEAGQYKDEVTTWANMRNPDSLFMASSWSRGVLASHYTQRRPYSALWTSDRGSERWKSHLFDGQDVWLDRLTPPLAADLDEAGYTTQSVGTWWRAQRL